MKAIRDFEEYVFEGIIKKQTPDLSRAKALVKDAEDAKRVLFKIIE